jgi:hypothetical protein
MLGSKEYAVFVLLILIGVAIDLVELYSLFLVIRLSLMAKKTNPKSPVVLPYIMKEQPIRTEVDISVMNSTDRLYNGSSFNPENPLNYPATPNFEGNSSRP